MKVIIITHNKSLANLAKIIFKEIYNVSYERRYGLNNNGYYYITKSIFFNFKIIKLDKNNEYALFSEFMYFHDVKSIHDKSIELIFEKLQKHSLHVVIDDF